MPRAKANGATPPVSERQRLEDGIRQLHARLQDIESRERFQKELREFLAKRRLLTRHDVTKVAAEVLPARFGQRGPLGALAAAERGGAPPTMRANAVPKATKIKFGAALAKWRRDKELTAQDVGKKLGIHFTTVSAWERGSTFPSEAKRAAILKATGLPESIFT
jgi:DNA-binding XRE family transcriptional regulator